MKPPKRYLVFFLSILAIATALRLNELDKRSLWFDEAFSWMLADQFSVAESVSRTAADVHPPLYYLALRGWIQAFGSDVVALRSLSVACGLLTIVGLLILCAMVAGPAQGDDEEAPGTARWDAAVICAVLCAASAVHIHWSQETRMYTLAMALAAFSAAALVRCLESPRRTRYWVAYSFLAACLLYTHNYGLFTVLAQAGFVLCRLLVADRRCDDDGPITRSAMNAVGSYAAIACIYAPWAPTLYAQTVQVKEEYWIPAIDWRTVPDCWFFLFFPENSPRTSYPVLSLFFSGILALCALRFLWTSDWRRRLIFVQAAVPIVGAAVVSLFGVSIITPRHFLLAYVFVLCMVSIAVADAVPAKLRLVAAGFALLLGLVVHVGYQVTELRASERIGLKGAVDRLIEERRGDEPVVVLHPCIYFSARYYLSGVARPALYYPSDGATHFTGAPVLTPDDFVTTADLSAVRSDRIWLLDTTGFGERPASAFPSEWDSSYSPRFVFYEVYFFQGSVSLTHCVRRPSRGTEQSDSTALSKRPE